MAEKRIFEKLEKINSKEEIIFKLEYKGKIIHQKNIEIPEYAKGIIDDDDLKIYYFFKDMANKLEEKITEVHKKKMWDELKNGKNGGTNTNQDSGQ